MNKALSRVLASILMTVLLSYPGFAVGEHENFLKERERIIDKEKQAALREKSKVEQARLQGELSEAAREILNSDSALSSQFQGYVEQALRLDAGNPKDILFSGAGLDTIKKNADFFEGSPPTNFILSEGSLLGAQSAINEGFKTTLMTELSTGKFKTIVYLWKQYMEAKLSVAVLAGKTDKTKQDDYNFLMEQATSPENTASLITDLLLQKRSEE
jgi:hypothetical protein